MRRLLICTAILVGFLASCGTKSAGATRRVLVDYHHDKFATVFPAYFPADITVRPGDTVHFQQAWNGEPHSVTLGTLVDAALPKATAVLPQLEQPGSDALFNSIFKGIPFMVAFGTDTVNQAGARPCYIDAGLPPQDVNTPCPKRPQPAFNGRQAFYSSGFIPYTGNEGNSYTVRLANDIKPGTYHYFCTFHGPFMQGTITVKTKGSTIPSQADVDRIAAAQVNGRTKPGDDVLQKVDSGPFDIVKAADLAHFTAPPGVNVDSFRGDYLAGFGYQGAGSDPASSFASINSFLPETIHTAVGAKVTWLFVGNHTVSFNVPRYFPQLSRGADGTVRFDHRAETPAGGPGFPAQSPNPQPPLYIVDGGHWNGKGFRSSGLPVAFNTSANQIIGFSLAFDKVGTYNYACLIHPGMVGKVVVSA